MELAVTLKIDAVHYSVRQNKEIRPKMEMKNISSDVFESMRTRQRENGASKRNDIDRGR